MNKIGFPRSRMKEERRIALLPVDISRDIKNPEFLYFERGYGINFGISDKDYRLTGAHVVKAERAYSLEILCQPKFCEQDLANMGDRVKTIFGWLHLDKDADKEEIELMSQRGISVIAWEFMRKEDGKNLFWVNGVLTGQIGILHAMPYAGKIPKDCNVAVIGRKRVGIAAINQLRTLGTENIDIYHSENSTDLKNKIDEYDVIVDCACSDTEILNAQDLSKMRPGALLIDMARNCMWGKYKPQSIFAPIVHINEGRNPVYCVRNIPTLAYQTATEHNSRTIAPYIDLLIKGETNKMLDNAVVIDKGKPILERL
jgi:N5-(carboxyethyl)ornithine synthase